MQMLDPKPVVDASAPVKAETPCGCHAKKPLDLKWLLYLAMGYAVAKAFE
jgi:hypothetical protein